MTFGSRGVVPPGVAVSASLIVPWPRERRAGGEPPAGCVTRRMQRVAEARGGGQAPDAPGSPAPAGLTYTPARPLDDRQVRQVPDAVQDPGREGHVQGGQGP